MKARINSKDKDAPLTRSLKGAGEAARECEAAYRGWLAYSELSEGEFLTMAISKEMQISCEIIEKKAHLSVGIGAPFLSDGEATANWWLDMQLLLLYIATRLDMAAKERDGVRGGDADDRHYQVVKAFIKSNVKD